MNSGGETQCRGCGRPDTELVLELGDIAASDYFPPLELDGPDPTWPLNWLLCRTCLLVQLGPVDGVLPESPMGVESATSRRHAALMAERVVAELAVPPGASVIEIDSHHGGSWLGAFAELGLVQRKPDEQADLVIDVHGIPHSDQLAEPLAAHAARVAPGGHLVFEFHSLLALVQQDQIDTIRHGHWVYLSLLSMSKLLAEHGLVIVSASRVEVFGGSLIVVARRASENPTPDPALADMFAEERAAGLDSAQALAAFGQRGLARAAALRSHLQAAKDQGRTVAGYGAPSKAPVLLALAGIGPDLLPFTVDLSPAKHGCRLPAVGVPIRSIPELVKARPDEVVVLTWDIATEIVDQLADVLADSDWDPDFVVPLPALRYVAGPRARQAAG